MSFQEKCLIATCVISFILVIIGLGPVLTSWGTKIFGGYEIERYSDSEFKIEKIGPFGIGQNDIYTIPADDTVIIPQILSVERFIYFMVGLFMLGLVFIIFSYIARKKNYKYLKKIVDRPPLHYIIAFCVLLLILFLFYLPLKIELKTMLEPMKVAYAPVFQEYILILLKEVIN